MPFRGVMPLMYRMISVKHSTVLLLFMVALESCLFLSPSRVHSDTIFFTNGTRLDVKKAWKENGLVKCELYGSVVGYPLRDVERVESSNDEPDLKTGMSVPNGGKGASMNTGEQYGDAATRQSLETDKQKQSDILLYHRSAREFARQGDWDKAIEEEKKAHALDPEREITRKTLSALYRALAKESEEKGKLHDAAYTLHQACIYAADKKGIQEDIASLYVRLAREAFNRGDYPMSKKHLRKAAYFDQNNPHMYVVSGKIAYNNDNYHEARNAWNKALALDPGLPDARMLLSRLEKDRSVEEGFKEKRHPHFHVKFAAAHSEELADGVADILDAAYDEVGRDLDVYPDAAIPVIVYPRSRLRQLDYFPDWAAGTYDGKIRIGEDIWHKKSYLKAVLYHEYAHVLVYILGGNNVPLWLNEGIAEYTAKRFKDKAHRRSRKRLLQQAAEQKALFSIDVLAAMNVASLSQLPGRHIQLVYAQSESFVTYLIENYSLYDMRTILVRLGSGITVGTAMRDILHEDIEALVANWEEQLR